MILLRKQITDYSRSCEHLIYEALSADATPFTREEIDWISYYTAEMAKLVDQLERKSKTQVLHDKQPIQKFAAASEALFLTEGLSQREKDCIRKSVSDVTTKILVEKGDPALER